MKKLIWVISGLMLVGGLPVLLLLEAMALGGTQVTDRTRNVAMITLYLIPLVWAVSLVLCIIESKRRNRPKVIRFYRVLPFAAWPLNPLAIMFASAVS
jgi:hypothetical protein